MNPRSQRAVALVVTLIMLSIVTFLAIAFLGIARRERAAVLISGSANDAYSMAVTGMNRGLAESIALIQVSGDKANYGLRVSTNFINFAVGSPILPGVGNVNYAAVATLNDLYQNIANLYYDARVPVLVTTNFATGQKEFRFYFDFNRNGRHESNGVLPELDAAGNPTGTFKFFVGDPEWIGTLLYPSLPHGPTNPFVGRYAFLVQPASKCIDLNFAHNRAVRPSTPNPTLEGFYRNVGAGTWEMNMAAFLVDLNTNLWLSGSSYGYNPVGYNPLGSGSAGTAFGEANILLSYRYNPGSTWNNLNSFAGMYPVNPGACATAGYDILTDDFPPLGPYLTPANEPANKWNTNWPGGDLTNANSARFLDMQELFNATRIYTNTALKMLSAGTSNSTYDRYMVYRMMEQLSVDSVPPRNRMNVNWTNDLAGSPESGTAFQDWPASVFFQNAAHLMLRASLATQYVTVPALGTNYYFGTNLLSTNFPPVLSSTNIAIWPYSEYLPEVHRQLQLAANMYDATTNRTFLTGYPYCPSVFRPYFNTNLVSYFGVTLTNIYIAGYVEEVSTNWLCYTNLDLSLSNHVDAIMTNGTYSTTIGGVVTNLSFRNYSLVNGQPIIIGAKKGFPNFNEFIMQTVVQATRKLEMVKTNATDRTPSQTNQFFAIGISNRFGVECWNSYAYYTNGNPYPRALQMLVTNTFTYVLTNEFGLVLSNSIIVSSNKMVTNWTGLGTMSQFQLPLYNTAVLLTNAAYSTNYPPSPGFPYGYLRPASLSTFDRSNGFPVPLLVLNITNHLVYALVDTNAGRVVDYVNLTNLNGSIDLMGALGGQTNVRSTNLSAGSFWITNRLGGAALTNTAVPTFGITNQINVALSTNLAVLANWRNWSLDTPILREILKFQYFMDTNSLSPRTVALFNLNRSLSNSMQCPFSPTRKIVQNLSWEVNDPLVHYTTRDITPYSRTNLQAQINYITPPSASLLMPNTWVMTNTVYRPWGGNPQSSVQDGTEFALWMKDPGVRSSDDWDFPTTKWANVGWLGRVHRGTPWQTVYMKSTVVNLTNWTQWAHTADTHPTNDWKLFDLFGCWPNNNAARGLLSVNQTNLAAWSAVLSDVPMLSNTVNAATGPFNPPNNNYTMQYIDPAGVSTNLLYIYNGIQARRVAMTNFTHVGDILSVPELTVISPFLNRGPGGGVNTVTYEQMHSLSDQMYERIPQQILGLLTVEDAPRFVIYAWGQALRPAERSLVTAPGPFYGMCTNYQIAAEYAVRAVVRVENLPTLGAPTNGLSAPRVIVESFRQLPNE